jgi:hypothetical protein
VRVRETTQISAQLLAAGNRPGLCPIPTVCMLRVPPKTAHAQDYEDEHENEDEHVDRATRVDSQKS